MNTSIKSIINTTWVKSNNESKKPDCYEYEVKIIAIKRTEWYYKILRILTFYCFFEPYYILEVIDGPNFVKDGN